MNIYLYVIIFLTLAIFPAYADPFSFDPDFIVEEWISGLKSPTNMIFLEDDLLVLEKGKGNIRLITNGTLNKENILHVDVISKVESGLIGITKKNSMVYIYYTAATTHNDEGFANQIYKFIWDGNELKNGTLIHVLPTDAKTGQHNGGAMVTGLDGTVYALVGDTKKKGILQNYANGEITDSGIILKVNFDESVLKPLETTNPQDHYYAMGIRNGFGLAIDPYTGFLWDTENGPTFFDEINLVEEKFNSGWEKVMGPANKDQIESIPNFHDFKYSDPEFSWEIPVAPTALTFVNSPQFEKYHDKLLVGDFNSGTLYQFKLDSNRKEFVFENEFLKDRVLNRDDVDKELVFARGFQGITDLEFGPDGFLYVLSFGDGIIYRIIPSEYLIQPTEPFVPLWLKNFVQWWETDQIDENTFLVAVEYLIEKNIIIISSTSSNYNNENVHFSETLKQNSKAWGSGIINDKEFVHYLETLIENGILKIDIEKTKCNSIPKPYADLSNCNLSKLNFSGKNLSKINMDRSNLQLTNLANSIIILGSFSESTLLKTNLSNAKLQGSNFYNSNMNIANFYKSDLVGSDLRNSTLIGTLLSYSDLQSSDIRNTDLRYAQLQQSNLERVLLDYSDLSNANLKNANLRKALLKNAQFENSNLENASLREITGSNVNFQNANLVNSNLEISKIEKGNFEGADLSGAKLRLARIYDSNLKNVPLVGADLESAKIKYSDLTGVNFTNANLKGTDFSGSILENVDFTGANTEACIGCPFNFFGFFN